MKPTWSAIRSTPVAGIVALGSTGEAILLSDEERRHVLKTTRDVGRERKVLIAGTGIESARRDPALTEYAAELGYDVAMVRTPHYYKGQMQPANMLAFYRIVADRSPLPVIIYNFPQATGYDIPAELVIELAEHPNVIGIKESSGDVEKVRRMVAGTRHVKRSASVTETFDAVTPRMLKAAYGAGRGTSDDRRPCRGRETVLFSRERGRRPQDPPEGSGFPGAGRRGQKLQPSLDAGAVGAILAFADPAPTACYEIYAAWKEGDHELARLKQERIAKAASGSSAT